MPHCTPSGYDTGSCILFASLQTLAGFREQRGRELEARPRLHRPRRHLLGRLQRPQVHGVLLHLRQRHHCQRSVPICTQISGCFIFSPLSL